MSQDFLTHVREVEEAAADAVPPAEVQKLGGWRLRFNHGVKRRPNSVLANGDDGTLDFRTKLAKVEAFYAARGLRARFQLSPTSAPGELDALLEARGYLKPAESVCVQVASLESLRVAPAPNLTLLERPDDAWLNLYCEVEELAGVQATAFRNMLTNLPGEAVFALVSGPEGRPAATGVGVSHGGLLGLFNIATHPAARRQGLASTVMMGLCGWGLEHRLARAYLQVAEGNTGAQTLYARLGFRTLYRYHYREQP